MRPRSCATIVVTATLSALAMASGALAQTATQSTLDTCNREATLAVGGTFATVPFPASVPSGASSSTAQPGNALSTAPITAGAVPGGVLLGGTPSPGSGPLVPGSISRPMPGAGMPSGPTSGVVTPTGPSTSPSLPSGASTRISGIAVGGGGAGGGSTTTSSATTAGGVTSGGSVGGSVLTSGGSVGGSVPGVASTAQSNAAFQQALTDCLRRHGL